MNIVLEILEDAAKRLKELDSEFHDALKRRDLDVVKRSMVDYCNILINLEIETALHLNEFSNNIKHQISNYTSFWKYEAEFALKTEATPFLVFTILTGMGKMVDELNNLEKLIVTIREEINK